VKLNNLLVQKTQFEHLLSTITERLELTEHLLDRYRQHGNCEVIAAHINSIKVCSFDIISGHIITFQCLKG